MLISRAIHIENEGVNLDKGTPETAPTWSACLQASRVVVINLIFTMISKSALNRIFQQCLEINLAPKLSKLKFKYVKSKSSLILKGTEIELRLWAGFNSSALVQEKNGSLKFNYTLHPFIEFTKFPKWYKSTFKKELTFKKQLNQDSIKSCFEINPDDFKSSDFFEPSLSARFKSNLTIALSQRESSSRTLQDDDVIMSKLPELISLLETKDNLEALCNSDFMPPDLQCHLLAYSGDLLSAQSRYETVYNDFFQRMADELDPLSDALKVHYQRKIDDLTFNYETLFEQTIAGQRQYVTARVHHKAGQLMSIGSCEYFQTTKYLDFTLPILYRHGLSSDSKGGIIVGKDYFIVPHHNNLKTKWDFEGNKLDEWKEEAKAQNLDRLSDEFGISFPKDTYESATTITKDRKLLFAGGYHSKGTLYNISNNKSIPLYAHETTIPGYKDRYNVSHNFGINQAKFVLNDSLLVVGGDHAKHVAWKVPNLERVELLPDHEFTFEGAPPSTEFANDIKQITSLDSCGVFVTIIRGHALIWDEKCNQTAVFPHVLMLKSTPDEEYLVIVDSENSVSIYKKQNS